MKLINEQLLTGERALFKSRNLNIINSNFFDGESPLKESKDINIKDCVFGWKYPLWYMVGFLKSIKQSIQRDMG